MNKKFKMGDIVVLVDGRYLSTLGMILAEKKHLFEVESVEYDRVDLKSTSTGLKTTVYEGNLRHATLKEQYLREGNSIVFDGKGYLVSGNEIIGLKSSFDTDYFYDDLSPVFGMRPITKVFNSPSGMFENKIDANHKSAAILWELKLKIELTSDEVIILKNIDEKYKHIARDSFLDALCVYEEEPNKNDVLGWYMKSDVDSQWEYLNTFKHLFQEITFESGVHLIADLLRHATLKEQSKIKLTSNEVATLKNIDKKYKYIARDLDYGGPLVVYGKEPKKSDREYIYLPIGYWEPLSSFDHLFQDITFESGAHLIDDLIKDNENV